MNAQGERDTRGSDTKSDGASALPDVTSAGSAGRLVSGEAGFEHLGIGDVPEARAHWTWADVAEVSVGADGFDLGVTPLVHRRVTVSLVSGDFAEFLAPMDGLETFLRTLGEHLEVQVPDAWDALATVAPNGPEMVVARAAA
ncbi:hypothetical protein [Brevibacterium litoralis]|uniref:hypothetical protein n=1 Tax=Brevibacterium litoralis TaxID=3138935 RepID=UPI0032F05735